MPDALTPARAAAHEALFVRLAALLRQVESVAARRPDAAVPPQTRAIAEGLLFDVLPFTPQAAAPAAAPAPLAELLTRPASSPPAPLPGHPTRVERRRPRPLRGKRTLPAAAESFGGLASQLGQARAELEAFEAAHSAWSAERKCFVWRLERAEPLPIQRLRPETATPLRTAMDETATLAMRGKILRRFDELFAEGYAAGYRDAPRRLASH